MRKTEYSNIDKNVAQIFKKNNIGHFAPIALAGLPVEKQIRDIFGDVKSIYVFYLSHLTGFFNLKKRRAFSAAKSENTQYLDSVFLRSLKIIFNEVERISFQISTYLESAGYESLPVPVRCIPGEEDLLPLSLIHVARYAGLGGEGENKCLITPDYGPRIIMGAVITSFICEDHRPEQIDPCRHCFKCADICPGGALTKARDKIYSWEKCTMCSLCELICPVGQTNQDSDDSPPIYRGESP